MSTIAQRVASKFLANEGGLPASEEQVAALPKSGPGLSMVKKELDALNAAFEGKDTPAFEAALDSLNTVYSQSN